MLCSNTETSRTEKYRKERGVVSCVATLRHTCTEKYRKERGVVSCVATLRHTCTEKYRKERGVVSCVATLRHTALKSTERRVELYCMLCSNTETYMH
jgi:hypothetical protein